MICKNENCKARISKKSAYCPKCGAKQYDESTPENADYLSMSSEEPNRTYRIKRINSLVCFFLPVVVVVFGFLLLKIGNSCSVDNSIETEPTTSITAETQATSSPELRVETHNYPMEWCPIEVTDVAVSKEESIKKTKLSANWTFDAERADLHNLVANKIVFYFTTYDIDGNEYYHSPSEFTISAPISNGAHEDSWFSYYNFKDAEIQKIKILFYDEFSKKNVEITYEPQEEPQTEPTKKDEPQEYPQTEPTKKDDNYNFTKDTPEDCPVKVTSYYTGTPNSADGVDVYINWYSESQDEIKYIYFYVTPYNRVDDEQRCEIRDYSTHGCYVTGPFYNGSSDSSYWDCIWYNGDIDYMKIDSIRIEYMDGNSKTYYTGW